MEPLCKIHVLVSCAVTQPTCATQRLIETGHRIKIKVESE